MLALVSSGVSFVSRNILLHVQRGWLWWAWGWVGYKVEVEMGVC